MYQTSLRTAAGSQVGCCIGLYRAESKMNEASHVRSFSLCIPQFKARPVHRFVPDMKRLTGPKTLPRT